MINSKPVIQVEVCLKIIFLNYINININEVKRITVQILPLLYFHQIPVSEAEVEYVQDQVQQDSTPGHVLLQFIFLKHNRQRVVHINKTVSSQLLTNLLTNVTLKKRN